MEITIQQGTETKLQEVSNKEWIVTNGIGGYSSSTISGLNTRRYHGVLVASFNPPTERMVLVSQMSEVIYYQGTDFELHTTNYEGGHVHPSGYTFLSGFSRLPLPVSTFKFADAEIEKTVFMVYNSNTTVIEYRNTSKSPYLLKLSPQYVHRDYHGLQHEKPNFDFQHKHHDRSHLIYAYYGAEPVAFRHTEGEFIENRYWNRKIEYAIDKERGQDFVEDIYSLGRVEHQLQPGQSIFLLFSTDEKMVQNDPVLLKKAELTRINGTAPDQVENQFLKDLIIAGDQFIVHRRTTDNYSVIAGYHWFTDWGRDSMIAIRGLCIATGRKEIAKSVILTFLSYLNRGIIPNRFPDYKGDMAEYNTVDATLWLFVAVHEYNEKFHDVEFLQEVFPRLTEIIDHHLAGTMHNIRVTEKGFLTQGSKDIQLTWMDARIRDIVFTPRDGCAVEINALWYNALRVYENVAGTIGTTVKEEVKKVRKNFEENFVRSFWNRDGYLNDIVNENRQADTAVRPNQIYAVSLPYTVLPEREQKFVVESVRKNLLTSYGLRTLHPQHPDFKSEYTGDVWKRDAAYHQGTVWPFLMPEYYMALLRSNDYSEKTKQQIAKELEPLKEHFYNEGCVHGISEIFDGLEPKRGKGCMHQAWSVSNLIMLMIKGGIRL